MDGGPRRVLKSPGSPQKYRPGGPLKRNAKPTTLNDPLLLSPDVLDDATRRELLHEVLRPRRASPSTLEPLSVPDSANSGDRARQQQQHAGEKSPFANQLRARVRAGSQNSDDLLTAMASRLKDLESKHKAYQSELQELHAKYRALNDRYQRERQLREEAETAVLTLYDEKELLEQQLDALEERETRDSANETSAEAPVSSDNRSSPNHHGSATPTLTLTTSRTREESKFDLFNGDFKAGGEEGKRPTPTHFTNTARPGTLLFSPQKSKMEVNGGGPVQCSKAAQQQTRTEKSRRHSAATVDVALLQKNARILSDYVGWKGVVTQGNQGGICERDVVRVVVYKNGICVNRGPFRPYGWALCDAFLDDLTEGYYPYEFKEKYPDGFPIEVTDCSSETCYLDENGTARAQGAAKKSVGATTAALPKDGGRRLGGASPKAGGQPRPAHTLQDCKDGEGYSPVSTSEFLSRVPAQRVTASGQLVSVRDDIAALMGVKGNATPNGAPNASGGPSATVIRAAAAEAASRRAQVHHEQHPHESPASPPHHRSDDQHVPSPNTSRNSTHVTANMVAVLVRLPDGQRITLQLAPEDTVAALRRELGTAAPQLASVSYELYQAFPAKCEWCDHQRTLASYGVYEKTCTLMVKLK
jgi:UBX domain-containing protein 11